MISEKKKKQIDKRKENIFSCRYNSHVLTVSNEKRKGEEWDGLGGGGAGKNIRKTFSFSRKGKQKILRDV